MAWYLYSTKGVPLFKFSDSAIKADPGSTNPYVVGNKVLAPERSYHIYLMPSDTPSSVVSSMQSEGKNVTLLPAASTTPGVSIVSRSYWSFANDNLGSYDRFGYGGPTDTPAPTITAVLTDATTGEITETPVENCSAQSQLPKKIWFDARDELADHHVQGRPGPHPAGARRPSALPPADRVRVRRDGQGVPAVAGGGARCSSTATWPGPRRTPTCSRHRHPAIRRTRAAGTSWRICPTTSCRSCTSRRCRASRRTRAPRPTR